MGNLLWYLNRKAFEDVQSSLVFLPYREMNGRSLEADWSPLYIRAQQAGCWQTGPCYWWSSGKRQNSVRHQTKYRPEAQSQPCAKTGVWNKSWFTCHQKGHEDTELGGSKYICWEILSSLIKKDMSGVWRKRHCRSEEVLPSWWWWERAFSLISMGF